MNSTTVAVSVISSVFSLLSGGAIWSYLRERRTNRAKSTVAEQTVDVEIDTNRMALLERQMDALAKSHDQQMQAMAKSFERERESLYSTIGHLREDLEEEQAEGAKKDEKIARLTSQVNEIQTALDQVKAELAGKPTKPDNGS